ncbi:helix-turn-helix domain-containing protein [Pseudomonas saponiphila]
MKINTNFDIGNKLRIARVNKGLSLDNVAEKIGLSKVLLWEIENRSVENLDVQVLNVIIKELSITYDSAFENYIKDTSILNDYSLLEPEQKQIVRELIKNLTQNN